MPRRLLQRLARLADHRLARNHFCDVEAGAKSSHDLPERHIRHAGHRREHDRCRDPNIADHDGVDALHVDIAQK